jgi:hypothetical protein
MDRRAHPRLVELLRAEPAAAADDVLAKGGEPAARGAVEDRVEVLMREVATAGHLLAPPLGEAAELVVPSDRSETVRSAFGVHKVV